jgi:ABC-2 type transport system ATP-binding protein
MTEPLLKAEALTKNYGDYCALDSLTLSIAPGEVVGLLGPNGSGKTTSLRLFLGFMRPTSGKASIAGFDCWEHSVEARRHATYLPGELRLYESMTGRQLVAFLAKLRGTTIGAEVDALAKRLDIDPDKQLTQMSSGMKRKVALLAVLVPNVPLIILDEPTNTLDPTMRDEFIEQIKLAKAAGKAILFSSHVLQEVEAVCDRVAILRKGKLVHMQDMAELREARKITGRFEGTPPAFGPEGQAISPGPLLDLEHRGTLTSLLNWLAQQKLAELKIEPLGLGKIYRTYHANG